MKNIFKREMKNGKFFRQNPIMDNYCHGLKEIKIPHNNDLHFPFGLAHGHQHVCFDVD